MFKVLRGLLNIGLVLFFVVIFSTSARAEVGTPKITKLTAQAYLSLAGLAPSGSEILIYLDGSFIGQTEARVLTKAEAAIDCPAPIAFEAVCQSSWYFQYNPSQKFATGTHLVMAVAKDKTSLVLSAPTDEIKFTINSVPAPTLISPNEKTLTADLQLPIIGLTKDNTSVKIYIDGIFNGTTDILKNISGTANFSFKPAQSLNRGSHKVSAIAVDTDGQLSSESVVSTFKIELPFPAPTIFKPVVNRNTALSRPFIVGLAKNDSKIKVYIDKKYNGELTVNNHPSGTANFAYKPKTPLIRGDHSVYTVAIDKRGKASAWSNLVNFSTKNSAISESVQEVRKDVVANIKEPVATKPVSIIISSSSGAVIQPAEEAPPQQIKNPSPTEAKAESADNNLAEKQQAIKQQLAEREKEAQDKVNSLIGANKETPKNDRGMVNEDKQNQSKLKLSVILFILFLVGVVAWLLWVNRELVKERRAQNEADAKAEEKNNISPSGEQKDKLL